MADARDRDYTNFVTLSGGNGHDALLQERYTTLELFNSARRDFERYINQTTNRPVGQRKTKWKKKQISIFKMRSHVNVK